jgi:hypothetical protein
MMKSVQKLALTLFVLLLVVIPVYAQDDTVPEPTQRADAPFRLFRTLNIHTFLKLDTRTGQVWQLQWSTDGNNGVWPINLKPLTLTKTPGRFTLFPTKNIFNFVLLDQEDGREWQVQWSMEDKGRFIIPIDQ